MAGRRKQDRSDDGEHGILCTDGEYEPRVMTMAESGTESGSKQVLQSAASVPGPRAFTNAILIESQLFAGGCEPEYAQADQDDGAGFRNRG